jgi:arylsulfatase A-like enzyme
MRRIYGLEEAGMAQMDDSVGALLKHVDDVGEADNTIVIHRQCHNRIKRSGVMGRHR